MIGSVACGVHPYTHVLIRPARPIDFDELYALGKSFPELRTSAQFEFMEPDEFLTAMTTPSGVFLCGEDDGRLVGFVYANTNDIEKRNAENTIACLVYIAVLPEFRRRGLGRDLHAACLARLKELNVKYLYVWANVESPSITAFMQGQGFVPGSTYLWMDREL